MSANYTAKRLAQLESETHGPLALGTKEYKSGWQAISLPSGEAILTLALDYEMNEQQTWNSKTYLVNLSEMLPTDFFSEVNSSECHATDVSITSNPNTIVSHLKQFASVDYTGVWTLFPLETKMEIDGYSLPSKIHIEWKVRGIKKV